MRTTVRTGRERTAPDARRWWRSALRCAPHIAPVRATMRRYGRRQLKHGGRLTWCVSGGVRCRVSVCLAQLTSDWRLVEHPRPDPGLLQGRSRTAIDTWKIFVRAAVRMMRWRGDEPR